MPDVAVAHKADVAILASSGCWMTQLRGLRYVAGSDRFGTGRGATGFLCENRCDLTRARDCIWQMIFPGRTGLLFVDVPSFDQRVFGPNAIALHECGSLAGTLGGEGTI